MAIRFQVDPDFYDHPKCIDMSDAATALWVRAGSYSAAKLTDGFVAETVLARLSRTPDEAAAELVTRGLWRRVKGGYRFHEWDRRNLTKARVEADREADRRRKRRARSGRSSGESDAPEALSTGRGTEAERKRRERHAARLTAGQREKPQVTPEIVRPESDRSPTGFQADSERIPPVSVSVSVSESVSGSGHASPAAENDRASPRQEPPRTCPEHHGDPNPPRCGPCADARRAWDAWDAERRRRDSEQRSAEARRLAAANAAAIAACQLCDDAGYRDGRVCTHDPDQDTRARTGAAAARAALTKNRPTEQETTDGD